MTTDAELLIDLATLDEVEARIPTGTDHDHDITPQWCELVLKLKRSGDWPINQGLPLRRHDGELIIEVLSDVLRPDRPSSASSGIWDELDTVVDSIQRRIARGKPPLKADVGQALGLATALAYIANPANPDVDEIRAEAMERWEERHS